MTEIKADSSLLTTPRAILFGSLLISFSILLSGGIITLKGAKSNTAANQVAPAALPQAGPKTETGIVNNLKTSAKQLGLDVNKFNSCLDSGSKADLVRVDQDEGSKLGVNGTPASFVNGHLISGAVPYDVFKKVIDFELTGGSWDNLPDNLKTLVGSNGMVSKEKVSVSTGNLQVKGNVNAPVTLVIFSDYQCPFCERLYQQSEKQLTQDYVNSGKVKIYFRDFPLTQIHVGAEKAAEAARCAGDQGKYWQYHDSVFENQSQIF